MKRKDKYIASILTVIFALLVLLYFTRSLSKIDGFQTTNLSDLLKLTLDKYIDSLPVETNDSFCDVSGVCRVTVEESADSILIYETVGDGTCEKGFTMNPKQWCVSDTCDTGFTKTSDGKCEQITTTASGSSTVTRFPAIVPPSCPSGQRFTTKQKKCMKPVGRVADCMMNIQKKYNEILTTIPDPQQREAALKELDNERMSIMACYSNQRSDLKKIYGTDYTLLFQYYIREGRFKLDNPCCKKPTVVPDWIKYTGIGVVAVIVLFILKSLFFS